ncbi:hypothetical protein EX895_003511 [Sporisorium graminicola]|uniref:t-SNARE coiled-coil homology domain-containing protein n=1 Tax=Sporisorium graminicola TaxID=280036 RepID=A0A4U7KTV8_9BASI|nr:hypothetical protein EX895_003511 [Sporisorium graminicola]TKY87497.1 hypothetical protein EX895_003511 [Sporisorium graminicola]
MSSQSGTISSWQDVPMSANARYQFQQYLARLPSASGTGSSSSSSSSPSDADALLRRSESLASRVDALQVQISGNNGSSDDPQLFWSTLTLLTNLRQLASQLQRAPFDSTQKNATETALARTQQGVGIVESLLCVLSVSSQKEEVGGAFTAPVRSQSAAAASAAQETKGDWRGYEYWKQKTLSAVDADDVDAHSTSSVDDDDEAASDAESVLTDPDIHLANPATTKLGGIKPDSPSLEEDDWSEYDRAPRTSHSAPTSPPPPPTATASDTILQSDRATHEALSSELLRMASVLKSNSLAFADSLERDRLLLEKAGTDLGSNLDLMTRTRGKLGVYSKKARSMGWFTLSAILVVIVSWMLMFLLIRLT